MLRNLKYSAERSTKKGNSIENVSPQSLLVAVIEKGERSGLSENG